MTGMKSILFSLIALFLCGYSSSVVLAFESVQVVPSQPYEAIGIDSRIATARSYYGELQGDPHLYEFAIGESETLSVQVQQRAGEPLPLSVMIVKVKDNGRGVREIGRVSGLATSTWKQVYDSRLGMSLAVGEPFSAQLDAGIYRVEISTPENIGKYLFTIGNESSDAGYFASIASIYRTQRFFESTPLRIFLSSYVYYPIGSLFLLVLIYYTWRYYKRIRHA